MRGIWTALVVAAVSAFLVPGLGSASSSTRLTVEVAGNGTVTSAEGGISCPPDCEESYDEQATVELTARPNANDTFQGWGGDCQGSTKCAVQMTGDRKVTATFTGASAEPSPTPTATATAEPSPTATAEPTPTASPAPTATASPQPTATPAPSQDPEDVAAHLIGRVKNLKVVRPGPRPFSIAAARRFECRRACVVAALLRSRSGKKPTIARGSTRVPAGGTPGVTLRFTKAGRGRLADGGERARLRITVQLDGRLARRYKNLAVRVSR